MNIEKERADFEMWCHTRSLDIGRDDEGDYISLETALSWEAYQAGRAALPTQPKAEFEDPRVQKVYEIICGDNHPPAGEHWDGYVSRLIVDALQSQDQEEIMEMALCESRRLVLRIGQAYRFTPMDGCKTCEEMKEEHDQAYSIGHARRIEENKS